MTCFREHRSVARAVLLVSLSLGVPAWAADPPPTDARGAQVAGEGLAAKLVSGSPWRFTTPYENTVLHFRFGADGGLQRRSDASPDGWRDVEMPTPQTGSYRTQNGHTITFSLGPDGVPVAKHSRHASQFGSIRQ